MEYKRDLRTFYVFMTDRPVSTALISFDRTFELEDGGAAQFFRASGGDAFVMADLLLQISRQVEVSWLDNGRIMSKTETFPTVTGISVWNFSSYPTILFSTATREVAAPKVATLMSRLLGCEIRRAYLKRDVLRKFVHKVAGRVVSARFESKDPLYDFQDVSVSGGRPEKSLSLDSFADMDTSEITIEWFPGMKAKVTSQGRVAMYNTVSEENVINFGEQLAQVLFSDGGLLHG